MVILLGDRTAVARRRLSVLKKRQHFKEKREEILQEEISKSKIQVNLTSVASIAGYDHSLVRIMCGSMEDLYELLREILKPLSSELPGLHAYADRCLGVSRAGLAASDPINLLRSQDSRDITGL